MICTCYCYFVYPIANNNSINNNTNNNKHDILGFSIIAISMIDLYPQDSWNFVFGQARTTKQVGVFSFARYSPSFYSGSPRDQPLSENDKALLLVRACGV